MSFALLVPAGTLPPSPTPCWTPRRRPAAALLLGALLASLALSGASCGRGGDDAEAVRATFRSYREAVAAADGEAAWALLSEGTQQRWQHYAELARGADADTIRALATIDRLLVLVARITVPRGELATITGEQLFVRGVRDGTIRRAALRDSELGNITFSGDEATAELVTQGERAPLLTFVREGESWRWDLGSVLDASGLAIEEEAQQGSLSLEQLLFTTLSVTAGRPVDESIYEPPSND